MEYLGIVVLLTAAALVAVPASHVYAAEEAEVRNPLVTMDLGELGVIKAELFPDVAPKYGEQLHLPCAGGVLRWGDFPPCYPRLHDSGRRSYRYRYGRSRLQHQGEFSQNGFENSLKHERVISMARTSVPDSAGSQFFIMVADHLTWTDPMLPLAEW